MGRVTVEFTLNLKKFYELIQAKPPIPGESYSEYCARVGVKSVVDEAIAKGLEGARFKPPEEAPE